MKLIKILLSIIVFLLVIGIGLAVYVWHTLQNLETKTEGLPSQSKSQIETEKDSQHSKTEATVTPSAQKGDITIHTTTLTPAQQTILKSFGVNGEYVTVTQDMVTCAENAVSPKRFNEIINGSAPNPMEAIKLVPCFK